MNSWMMNSLPPRLNVSASDNNSSATQSPPVTERNTGTYSQQQFLPGDGIDMRVLKTYIAHHYGDSIDWRPAVNTTDGKEGFLFRASAPIGPETVRLLQQETKKLREAEKQHSCSKYLDKLHTGWTQHQHNLAYEAQNVFSVPTHSIDRNLPVPFQDLPPKYDDIEGSHSHRKSIQLAPQTLRLPMALGLRRRPASCSDLELFSPSGGFYLDGYSGLEAEVGEDANGLTFSRLYGPPGLPEFMPMHGSDRGFSSSTAPQNANSLHQGYSDAGSTCNRSTHIAALSRARSTTSLHSSHSGFVYQPGPRLDVPSKELFFGTLETSLDGNDQELGPYGLRRNYAEGWPG
ncbi:hypothetical protein EV426DRAFT_710726 [Tirmania nivea]|nr:hypothetical protein EV426DRAFT_710726 [Tirmania nivea]